MRGNNDLRGYRIIDSRDVIARFDALEEEKAGLVEEITKAEEAVNEAEAGSEELDVAHEALTAAQEAATEWEYEKEYQALKDLIEEAEDCRDWRYGETLIREDYFSEYAQELAYDIGAIPRHAGWPCTCIDWEDAAKELKRDYTAVQFDGETYYIRN